MEVEVHGTEVHLQLGRVLLLLEELLLSFSLLPGLTLFEFFLGLAGFTLLLLVFLLFHVIVLLLHLTTNGLWNALFAEVVHVLGWDVLWVRRTVPASVLRIDLFEEDLRRVSSVREFQFEVVVDYAAFVGFRLKRDEVIVHVLLLFIFEFSFFHLREHRVVDLGEEYNRSRCHVSRRWRERQLNLHHVAQRAERTIVPELGSLFLRLEAILKGHCANLSIIKFLVDAHSIENMSQVKSVTTVEMISIHQ